MVDPRSWILFSVKTERYKDQSNVLRQRFDKYEHYRLLGYRCECTVCDEAVGEPDPILPIRDFYYPVEDGLNGVLNDDFYLLCSPVVRGYALNERKWRMHNLNSPSTFQKC